MNELAIIAWYGLLLVGPQWELVGPYDSRDECAQVVEWLDRQGHETDACSMVETGAESILIQLPTCHNCTAKSTEGLYLTLPGIYTSTQHLGGMARTVRRNG